MPVLHWLLVRNVESVGYDHYLMDKKTYYLYFSHISISHEHPKILMFFVGNLNKQAINVYVYLLFLWSHESISTEAEVRGGQSLISR